MKEEFKDELAHALLIELLSFQFASPVKWIETQDVLINKFNIDNFIEIGPQPILANMMKKTYIGKADSMNFGKQKTDISTYCVSDIESIPYYTSDRKSKNNPTKSISKDDMHKMAVFNPYRDFINFKSIEDSHDMISYQTFVCNEKSTNTKKSQRTLNEEDIANEKLRFKQFQRELQSSSMTSKLLHEYTKASTESLPTKDSSSPNLLSFKKTRIREYDNPHAWIRSLSYKIACLPTFNPEHYSYIKRLVHVYNTNPSIRNEIDCVLEYNMKNFAMLQMYLNVYHKEQTAQKFEFDDRCDSGVTLYDGDLSSNEEGGLESINFSSKIVYKWDNDSKVFIERFDSSTDDHESFLNHVFKQCDVVFTQNSNITDTLFKFLNEYFQEENACMFIAVDCQTLKEFYDVNKRLQNLYIDVCTMTGNLYVLPYSKENEDFVNIIECVYKDYELDIGHVLVYDDFLNLKELSSSISLAKSKLNFVSPNTQIISSFKSNMDYVNNVGMMHIDHIQYEAFDSEAVDFNVLFNIKGNHKVQFLQRTSKVMELPDTLINKGEKLVSPLAEVPSLPRPNYKSYEALQAEYNGSQLQEFLEPKNLVVITGFSELGPLGNASTRWDYEKNNETFSTESILYLGIIMNLIKYDSKTNDYVDIATNKTVEINDIRRYETHIIKHTGIRILDYEVVDYDPHKKTMLQEVVLMQDFQVVVCEELMKEYKLMHDESQIRIVPLNKDDLYEVHFCPGTKVYLPKAFKFDRYVSGQIPLGWDPSTYGISQDIVDQVDRLTLFALITTVEALFTSGIIDPYELYEYMDISKVGNCSGSGLGGIQSHQKMQRFRYLHKGVQNDIIQETFINCMSAWINMLILSSAGPLKTPVGACATAIESLDLGYDIIMSGKANVVLVGGYDDLGEETSYEFANMGATSNAKLESEKFARLPKEICRPMTKSRNGFTESHGAGMQVLVRGDIAIEMGLPCYGIVNYTSVNSDKISKSLPAPGKGVLTAAKKSHTKFKQRKLDVSYRKKHVEKLTENDEYTKRYWQIDYFKNDIKISPIQGSLSIFGLDINDIGVSSCHGTSTKANDKNETNIINTIMSKHNREKGNLLPIVCQKAITGHPKAAAGAWMLNGLLQIFKDEVIPGNTNADNVDKVITEDNEYLLIDRSNILPRKSVKAGLITSFGFGQKGALSIIVNPNFLLACLSEEKYKSYMVKYEQRYQKANYEYGYRMLHKNLFQEKNVGPYGEKPIEEVYLGI
ncbi:uncharacterized protein HGUI_00346 [Hanseniaspora guilliermondii]|uniref:beta-ketoacyl-[acyl-carrier-protein] synthase I n=1 Tax=Hanseniaspora guilliermondii TaxID=56406 RepID=A0A1L0AUA9_9ASCO|nr:uncharacterized protein HGUI_00346 [Hanseniaspora guilliermondii]